ncbi:MAG: RluA family pseudouridine synthase [Candidatus Omnitrophota bacterium]|jgi:23S rRNA pseudouridine1911/1915/1917 synthase|nr:MAG: RluA family pseudouridine synthase [Candidatus Omnitrophota bacterium]
MKEYTVTVDQAHSGKRLDLFLYGSFGPTDGFSRTFLQGLIRGSKVKVNASLVTTPHHKVFSGDTISVSIPDKETHILKAEPISLQVYYEDEDVAVIEKPSGLVVHPAPGNYGHTLVNALIHRFAHLSDVNPGRPGIVHRLDKETSGVMVVTKTNFAHLALAKQFAAHSIKRIYVALVKGRMKFDENIIELPIGRHPYKRKQMSVLSVKNPRYAKTFYRTLKRTDEKSLLELHPHTGRTHQLRVHLAFIGHPIMGDTKYGKNNACERLALHATTLGFFHPRRKKFVEFHSQLPELFVAFSGCANRAPAPK